MLRVYADLLTELRTALDRRGIDVAPLVIAQDFSDLSNRLTRREVDMVIETLFVTLDLQTESLISIQPSLAIVRRGQREYRSVFFTRKDSKIRRLEDLRGKVLVLQADRSTTAFAVPRAELARFGIPTTLLGIPGAPRGGVHFAFAGAELNQAIWVLKGRGDAGAFNEGDWDRMPRKIRDGLTIFHETKPLLRGLVSFRPEMDTRVREAVEDALLAMHETPSGRAALSRAAGISRFERLTPWDLAGVNEWRRALKGVVAR